MSRILIVLVTVPTRAVARRIAEGVIRQRLAACVNVLPGLESAFSWQGKFERSTEVLLLIKTTASRYPALQRAIRARHPYEMPEIIALPVAAGLPAYLTWVRQSVS